MTDLEKMYHSARRPITSRGGVALGHFAALRAVALATGIDPETVGRCLDRAKEADAIDARRARRGRKGKGANR